MRTLLQVKEAVDGSDVVDTHTATVTDADKGDTHTFGFKLADTTVVQTVYAVKDGDSYATRSRVRTGDATVDILTGKKTVLDYT